VKKDNDSNILSVADVFLHKCIVDSISWNCSKNRLFARWIKLETTIRRNRSIRSAYYWLHSTEHVPSLPNWNRRSCCYIRSIWTRNTRSTPCMQFRLRCVLSWWRRRQIGQ